MQKEEQHKLSLEKVALRCIEEKNKNEILQKEIASLSHHLNLHKCVNMCGFSSVAKMTSLVSSEF